MCLELSEVAHFRGWPTSRGVDLYSWNIENEYEGQGGSKHIDTGGVGTFTIDASTPGQRAEYVGVASDNDASCIAWITVSQFDGTPGGAVRNLDFGGFLIFTFG